MRTLTILTHDRSMGKKPFEEGREPHQGARPATDRAAYILKKAAEKKG